MRPVEVVLGVLIFAMAAGHSSANYCVCKSGVDEKSLQSALDFACGAGADCNAISPNGACYNPNSLQAHCSYAVNSYYQKKAASGATCDFNGAATLSSSNPSASGGCNYASGSGSSSGSSGAPTSGGGSPTSGGTSGGSPTSGGTSSGSPSYGSGSGSPTYGSGSGSGTTPVTVTPSTTPTTPSSSSSGTGGTGSSGSTSSSPYSSSTPTTSATPSTSSPGILGGVGTGLGPTATGMDDSYGGTKLQCGNQWMIFLASIIPGVMLLWN